jgi:SAM-dependent methyltransferase
MTDKKDLRLCYYETFWENVTEFPESEKNRVKTILGLLPSDVESVLDIGCGDGRVTNVLPEPLDVVGVDFSGEAVKKVRRRAVLTKSDQLPFGDKTFDLVLISDVLEHLSDREYYGTIEEMKRTAKKYILINSPDNEVLGKGTARCADCRKTFHVSLHARSICVRDMEKLFSDTFSLKRVACSGERWDYDSVVIRFIRQRILHSYTYYHLSVCPHCGRQLKKKENAVVTDSLLTLLSGVNAFLALARRLAGLKEQPVEFFVLLERKGSG